MNMNNELLAKTREILCSKNYEALMDSELLFSMVDWGIGSYTRQHSQDHIDGVFKCWYEGQHEDPEYVEGLLQGLFGDEEWKAAMRRNFSQ